MTSSSRILANTFATYGRSLVALFLGLFSTRWILAALGAQDFGLYGVVGSIIAFVMYLNSTLSGAVSRFYAFSIGRGHQLGELDAANELKHWFNIAVFIHTLVPIVLVCIGYPVGIYAIKNWLIIPDGRVCACVWVFRFAMLSAFVSMVIVPYTAMFQARQFIMELSLVSIVSTFVSFGLAYILTTIQGDRLIVYAFYLMAIAVVMGMIQVVWAVLKFKECRIEFKGMVDVFKMKEFLSFAGAKLFGSTCVILRTQGGSVLLNQFFAPVVNAAYIISVHVSSQTTSLAQSMIGALQPAVVTKAGAEDIQGMIRYAISSCRIASLLVMIFIIPLAVEIQEVLRLWLGNPPRYASSFCLCALAMLLFDKMSVGYMLAANAYGKKIVIYELVLGAILFTALPLAYICFFSGLSPYFLSVSLAVTMLANSIARVLFCRWQLKMSFVYWLKSIVCPVVAVVGIGYAVAFLLRSMIIVSIGRVLIVSGVSGMIVLLLGWRLILSCYEREFICRVVNKIKESLCH